MSELDRKEELFEAIRKGKANTVVSLLRNGCSANARVGDDLCTPAIILAVTRKRPKATLMLLRYGASVDAQNKRGMTAFLYAAEYGFLEFLKVLADYGANAKAVDSCGATALMLASKCGRYESLWYLIDKIRDVDGRDNTGKTALMHSAIQNEERCLRLLIHKGADMNFQDYEDGYSALMYALKHRSSQCVETLLNSGSNVNVMARDRETTTLNIALFDTQQSGNFAMVEKLLQRGANLRLSPKDQAFLHELIAKASRNKGDASAYIRMQRIIRLMVINGCPPLDKKCWEYFYPFAHHHMPISPLCVALLSGCYDIAKYFVVNRFFTNYDMTTLPNDPEIRQKLQNLGTESTEALSVLDHMCGSPQTLGTLSFVKISETFNEAGLKGQGTIGRKNRIKASGLPRSLQTELLFRGLASKICVLHWHDLCLDYDQVIEVCNCSDCMAQEGYKPRQRRIR